MSLFTPELEPGERLIGQLPPQPTKRQLVPGAVLATVTATAFFTVALWLSEIERALTALPICISIGLLIMAALWNDHHWAVALTNRRLLVRRGMPWRAPNEIPREEIDSVTMDIAAYKVLVRGHGQEIRIDPMQVNLADLQRLLSSLPAGHSP